MIRKLKIQGIEFEPEFTTDQVCQIFKISKSTLFRWEKTVPGFPKAKRINRKVLRFRASDIEDFYTKRNNYAESGK